MSVYDVEPGAAEPAPVDPRHHMNGGEPMNATDPTPARLEQALAAIARTAQDRDRAPRFPADAFEALRGAGVPQLAGDRGRCDLASEIELVRAVARVDASCARILDGHFNGVERLALGVTGPLRERELQAVAAGKLLLGVWGADPAPGEGQPARLDHDANGAAVLNGVKTFCSGAGGVQRALVVVRGEGDRRQLAYVETGDRIVVDRSWYRASGLRSSESHRVEFIDTPVLAVVGVENELTREPWFSRDAVRTAATWAGIVDSILEATLDHLGERTLDPVGLHGLGRIRIAIGTIDRWLDDTVDRLNTPEGIDLAEVRGLSGECRLALADAARLVAEQAAKIVGSRALVDGGRLDRARRDLDLFLLQHRLDPELVRVGERMCSDRGRVQRELR